MTAASSASERLGFCVWFTGLSGAGKTTTAQALVKGLEDAGRTVTLLDGDDVRRHLSAGLGFSRADRDANVARVAFVAREIVRHGGAVVVAMISPYRDARAEARAAIGSARFVEVFVDTPADVCERRDPKGLYGRARRAELAAFTGVDDPYERPETPDLTLDTVARSVEANVTAILETLAARGYLDAATTGSRETSPGG